MTTKTNNISAAIATPSSSKILDTKSSDGLEKSKALALPAFWEDFYGRPYYPNPYTWQTQQPKEWLTPPTREEYEEAMAAMLARKKNQTASNTTVRKSYDAEKAWSILSLDSSRHEPAVCFYLS